MLNIAQTIPIPGIYPDIFSYGITKQMTTKFQILKAKISHSNFAPNLFIVFCREHTVSVNARINDSDTDSFSHHTAVRVNEYVR